MVGGKKGQKRPRWLRRSVIVSSRYHHPLLALIVMTTILLSVLGNIRTVSCLHESAAAAGASSTSSSSEDPPDNNNHHRQEEDGTDGSAPPQLEHQADNQTGPSTAEAASQSQKAKQQQQEEGRLWGAAAGSNDEIGGGTASPNKIPFVAKPGGTKTTTTSTHQQQQQHHTTIYQDPFSTGFQITTRVYTDVHDKKAHFDNSFFETVVLPYWECGVTGSTTVPIPLHHVQVRHLLGGAKPSSFSVGGGEDNFGPQPQLVVALTPLEIVLNSGQQQTFAPGDVILLENVIAGGHKLQGVAASGDKSSGGSSSHHHHHNNNNNMICMLLTLPNAYHHIGKDKNSLQTVFEKSFWKQNPCKTGLATVPGNGVDGSCVDNSNSGAHSSDEDVRSSVLSRWAGPPRAVRRVGLGVIGAGLSLAIADFLGKCAPFILAVAFGGGALVVGGTYGVVKLGEMGIDEVEVWNERRLLRLQSGIGGGRNDDDDDDEEDERKRKKGLYDPDKRIADGTPAFSAPETDKI